MIEFVKLILPKDPKLLMWFIVLGAGAWYNLKTDQIKISDKVEFLQYQINELKAKEVVAVLPKELKLEEDF